MLNGYIGIVSRRGLCQIQVERQEVLQQIYRSATLGKHSPRIGFWATLPEEAARHISTLVLHGECHEALRILNQSARESGHLLPLHQ